MYQSAVAVARVMHTIRSTQQMCFPKNRKMCSVYVYMCGSIGVLKDQATSCILFGCERKWYFNKFKRTI